MYNFDHDHLLRIEKLVPGFDNPIESGKKTHKVVKKGEEDLQGIGNFHSIERFGSIIICL